MAGAAAEGSARFGTADGNWPAKIGGALIVVGAARCCATRRSTSTYLPVQARVRHRRDCRLGFGFIPYGGERAAPRDSLALGGAAFGVAYLTAYSAFALFGYLPTLQGLACWC